MNRDWIQWLILGVVVVAATGGLYVKQQAVRPCATTITYAIGTIDPRFGLTQIALRENTHVSANIWNKAAGRTVLAYDPSAKLKINLVYDEREVAAQLGARITRLQETGDTERARLDALEAELNAAQQAYNQKVSEINARGGASRREAEELERERAELNAQSEALKRDVERYNAGVAELNALIREYNQSAGRTFEQGRYVRDAQGERIAIFEFIGATQLRRVLAHEFGHAIGLAHNDDPKSIMFAKNESGNLVPTEADLTALTNLCDLK